MPAAPRSAMSAIASSSVMSVFMSPVKLYTETP